MSQESAPDIPKETVETLTLEPTTEVNDDNLRQEDPWVIIIMFAISVFMAKLWRDDYIQARKGTPNPNGFPGATACPPKALWIAVIGSLILLGAETIGEYLLGISEEQSDIKAIFLFAMIAAAFVEELIFRGFLVIENKGRGAFLAGVIGFSFLFALFHPFLWEMKYADEIPAWQFWNATFSLNLTASGFFSFAFVFISSLWFYAMRFFAANPHHSLLAPVVAHLTKNLGVFVVKLAQGHVVGLY